MIKKRNFLITLLILCHTVVWAQNDTSCYYYHTSKPILGKKVISHNGTSILLMDTCNYANRLYRFEVIIDQSDRDFNFPLPAVIIDSIMFNKVETFLDELFTSSKKLKKDFYHVYRKGIKLLIGSIDKKTGIIYITMQLLTIEEYKSQNYYDYCMFLVNGPENLRWLVLSYQNNQFKLNRSYSYQR